MSSCSGPLESPTFFVDRSLGSRIVPAALRAAGARVLVHDDHFAQNALDVEWLQAAGREGWLVLTRDAAIASRRRRGGFERLVAKNAGVRLFVLRSGRRLSGAAMGLALAAAIGRMTALAARMPGPFVARVYADGRVRLDENLSG